MLERVFGPKRCKVHDRVLERDSVPVQYGLVRPREEHRKARRKQLLKLSVADKNELLFQRGINFNEVPNWQKRGIGVVWQEYEKDAVNAKTGEPVTAVRRRLQRIYDLPMRDEYSRFVRELIDGAH